MNKMSVMPRHLLIKTDMLNGLRNEIHIYVIYKKLSLKTGTSLKWKDGEKVF